MKLLALPAAAILLASSGAFATSSHTPPPPPPSTPSLPTTASSAASAASSSSSGAASSSHQGQRQHQGQAQSQRSSQLSSQSVDASSGSASGSSSVNIGGSEGDRLFMLPSVPMTPPSSVPSANVALQVTACGPRMVVDTEPIVVHNHGVFSSSDQEQGKTYTLKAASDFGLDDWVVRDGRAYGHQAILTYAVVSTGYARHLALGGGSAGGGWGSGGAGGSGANQQLVSNIQLIPCSLPLTPTPLERVVIERSPVLMPIKRTFQHRPALRRPLKCECRPTTR